MVYVSPCMDCIRVEAESDFMSGSVIKEKESEITSGGQELGDTFDAGGNGENQWSSGEWN